MRLATAVCYKCFRLRPEPHKTAEKTMTWLCARHGKKYQGKEGERLVLLAMLKVLGVKV